MPGFLGRSPFISRRIDRAVTATQFAGGILGILVGYAQFWFLDFWLGAVIASPIGIVVGIVWESRANHSSDIAWDRTCFAGFIWVVLVAIAYPLLSQVVAAGKANVRILNSLPSGSVEGIHVFTPWRGELLATVGDMQALAEFVDAARDVQVAYHGKAGAAEHIETWWIVVKLDDGRRLQLEWSHRSRSPDSMYGMFIETTSNSMSNRGEFVSAGLRSWFREHVEKRLP